MTDVLEEILPNTERVEIPNASHLMHEENASAFNEAILEFLGRHRDSSAPSP
jgi:pimeloyl-ACP methyl ester carboxylesterase